MTDKTIQGRAKKFDGTAIDYVSIFNWSDGSSIIQTTPNTAGEWGFTYNRNLTVGITYVADRCEPITHGPYDFTTGDAVIPIPDDYFLRYDFNGSIAELSRAVATTTTGSVAFAVGRKVGTQSADMSSGYINTTDRQTLGVSTVSASFWVNLLPTFSGSVLGSAKSSELEFYNAFVASVNASNGSLNLMQHEKYGIFSNSVANGLQSGVWTHILLEINRSSSSIADKEVIYINNMKASTKGIHISPVASTLENGRIYIGGIGLGRIQDLRIYDRLLTEAERLALFQE